MTLRNTHIILLLVFATAVGELMAGGLEKGLEALNEKDYFGAKKQFEKILFKDPVGGHYGLSLVHYARQNPFYDIDLSLKHCNSADSAFQFAVPRDVARLSEVGISSSSIRGHKKDIGIRAYEDLMSAPDTESIDRFLVKFRFSERYADVVRFRDEMAFQNVRKEDTYEAYRQFIIDYPGAAQRHTADSLYALRFFERKTAEGDISGYIQFVKEFPANPYTAQAFDTIFAWVDAKGTHKAYQEYLIEFPDNQHTRSAWKSLNLLMLKEYSKNRITDMISALTRNPFKDVLEEELGLMDKRRFVMQVDSQEVLIGIDGNTYGGYYDDIGPFSEGLARVTKGDKSGYINKAGRVIIPLQYDDAYEFSEGVAVVEKKGRFGAVDRFGDVALAMVYDELGNSVDGYMAYEKGGHSGFIDWRGNLKFGRTFEFAGDFLHGTAVVRVDGLYGAIDTTGKYTIPALYEWVEDNRQGFSRVRRDGLFGVYKHKKGLSIPIIFERLGELSERKYSFLSEGYLGYMTAEGDTLVEPQYEVYLGDLGHHAFKQGFATVIRDGKWGLIDATGQEVIAPKYDMIRYQGEAISAFRDRNKWGYVMRDGMELEGRYDSVGTFQQGVAVVVRDNKAGIINSLGNLILPMEYASLRPIVDTELVIFSKEGREGILDRDGVEVLAPVYDKVEAINIRFAKLHLENRTELYDLISEKVIWTPAP